MSNEERSDTIVPQDWLTNTTAAEPPGTNANVLRLQETCEMTPGNAQTQISYHSYLEDQIESIMDAEIPNGQELVHKLINEALNAYTELPGEYRPFHEIRKSLQHLPQHELERLMSAERAKRSRIRRQRRYKWLELLTPTMIRLTKRSLQEYGLAPADKDIALPHLSVGAANRLSGISEETFRLRNKRA